jgi:hypothetical protein
VTLVVANLAIGEMREALTVVIALDGFCIGCDGATGAGAATGAGVGTAAAVGPPSSSSLQKPHQTSTTTKSYQKQPVLT